MITVGELRLGVLAASDGPTRVRRLETLSRAEALEPLPLDQAVAHAWAALRLALRDEVKRMPLNDSWIAAIANRIPVCPKTATTTRSRDSRSSGSDRGSAPTEFP